MSLCLADAVLVLHFAVVLFVVGGLVAILAGNLRGWRWVNDLRFRVAHLVAIGFVAAQAWLGQTCPLTTLESWLRREGGGEAYAGGFIEHWIAPLMFFHAPAWVFTAAYTGFAALVALAWWRFPPRRRPASTTSPTSPS